MPDHLDVSVFSKDGSGGWQRGRWRTRTRGTCSFGVCEMVKQMHLAPGVSAHCSLALQGRARIQGARPHLPLKTVSPRGRWSFLTHSFPEVGYAGRRDL